MLIPILHLGFTALFAWLAYTAFPRGWFYTRDGWSFIQANAPTADREQDVHQRQAVEYGTRLLFAGVLWLVGGVVCVACAIYFGIRFIQFL